MLTPEINNDQANQISAATACLNNILRGYDIPEQLDMCHADVRKMIVNAAHNIIQNIEADAQLAQMFDDMSDLFDN